MHSKVKDNENLKFTFGLHKRTSSTDQTRKILPLIMLMVGFSVLLVFINIPAALAQTNTSLNNGSMSTLENVQVDTENTVKTGVNDSSITTNGTFNLEPDIQNLSLQSFSSLVNEINSKVRSQDSNNNIVSNNSSPSSSPTSDQRSNPSKLLSLKEIVIQNTTMSVPAPVRHPGQPTHEVVFALPLRNDGYIWTGTVTFTASKPIEVEVLHTYAPAKKPDSLHGEPYYAVLPGNNSIAITHLRHLVDVPIEINGTGISSGTLDFAGNALVFHKTTGEPFTVTYTIDAVSKELTKLD
jgi:hypothetical protein